jgi:acetyl-CoA carboxylase carboxyltransferase component
MDARLKRLVELREKSLRMGGDANVARQRAAGKLTARERVALLLDRDTFAEYGQLADHQSHRPGMAGKFAAADGVVTGFGKVEGRYVAVAAEDFTVMGGSVGITNIMKKRRLIDLAYQERVPTVWLLDGAGARAEEFIGEGLPPISHHIALARLSGIAPTVGVVLGPSAGDSSLIASLAEFIVMVKGTSMLAAGGPPVVLTATGEQVTKEELGGSDVHTRISGVADNEADSEEEAIRMAKTFLSYLPTNAWQYPPDVTPADDPVRRDESLRHLLPANPREPYDMRRIVERVVDRGSFFEIKPRFAAMMVTGFARLDGRSVGIVANQPKVASGAITAKSAQKARHFADLCIAYHVPLIFFTDVPGVMPGTQSEREGALRYGMAIAHSLAWANVPHFTIVLRKAFGYGGGAMGGGGYGAAQTVTLAWPTADFGSLPADSGVLAAYGAQIAAAADPAALRAKLEAEYREYGSAFEAAKHFNIDEVIDPADTRPRIIQALALAVNRRTEPAHPAMRHGVLP